MAGDIFRLRLYIDYDIPLVSLHLTFFVIVGYCSVVVLTCFMYAPPVDVLNVPPELYTLIQSSSCLCERIPYFMQMVWRDPFPLR